MSRIIFKLFKALFLFINIATGWNSFIQMRSSSDVNKYNQFLASMLGFQTIKIYMAISIASVVGILHFASRATIVRQKVFLVDYFPSHSWKVIRNSCDHFLSKWLTAMFPSLLKENLTARQGCSAFFVFAEIFRLGFLLKAICILAS